MTRPPLTPIPTRVAHAAHGENHYFGRAVIGDLLGRTRVSQLWALTATGHEVGDEAAELIDALAVICTAADPRIFTLKLVRLASSFGGALQGVAAGHLCLDCHALGPWEAAPGAARLLVDLGAALERHDPGDEGAIDAELRTAVSQIRRLPGFGVLFRPVDERVVALRSFLESNSWHRRPYWLLFERVARIAREVRSVEPNYAAAFAAACLDVGFSPPDVGALAVLVGVHTFVANAVEGAAQSPALLQRLPDELIDYRGRPPRLSPRARAAAVVGESASGGGGGAGDDGG